MSENATPEVTIDDVRKLAYREARKFDGAGEPIMNKRGEPVVEREPIPASEIAAFRDYGSYVVVVTTAGEKLRCAK